MRAFGPCFISGEEGADAGFSSGEAIALPVQGFVVSVMLCAEGAKSFFATPSVDGDIAAWNVSVFEELSAQVFWRTRKKSGPGSLRTIGGFEARGLFFRDVKLPQYDE